MDGGLTPWFHNSSSQGSVSFIFGSKVAKGRPGEPLLMKL